MTFLASLSRILQGALWLYLNYDPLEDTAIRVQNTLTEGLRTTPKKY
jgi:hypothetical protein